MLVDGGKLRIMHIYRAYKLDQCANRTCQLYRKMTHGESFVGVHRVDKCIIVVHGITQKAQT